MDASQLLLNSHIAICVTGTFGSQILHLVQATWPGLIRPVTKRHLFIYRPTLYPQPSFFFPFSLPTTVMLLIAFSSNPPVLGKSLRTLQGEAFCRHNSPASGTHLLASYTWLSFSDVASPSSLPVQQNHLTCFRLPNYSGKEFLILRWTIGQLSSVC